MIPTVLFDKSFLQSLSVDESVWFDNFFATNIAPVFLVETLADLEKALKAGRTPEQEVGLIALKTPELQCYPNVLHYQLCGTDLLGNPVQMNGQIQLAGYGKAVKTADQNAVVLQESREAEALRRWQGGEFLVVERQFAKLWRKMLGSFSQDETLRWLQSLGITSSKCRDFNQAKAVAESVINRRYSDPQILAFALSLLRVSENLYPLILDRWIKAGRPLLPEFAPYASYALSVELFYLVAASSNLIFRKKASSKVDLSYMFYLPFCMIFVSSDKLHRNCAPLFMRDEQEFVWGPQLKEDLRRIDCYYDRLPASEKDKGIMSMAQTPPLVGDFLVGRLWDTHCPGWRELASESTWFDEEVVAQIRQQTSAMARAKALESDQVDFDPRNPEAVLLKRTVHEKRGKWWQGPKELRKNGAGDY
jgi:hypothetical protein